MAMETKELAPAGTTGTGRHILKGVENARVIAIEYQVQTAGSSVSWTLQGSIDRDAGKDLDTDKADANALWETLNYVVADAATAAVSTPQTGIIVGKKILFIKGLDDRRFRKVAVNVSANTGQVYSIRAHILHEAG